MLSRFQGKYIRITLEDGSELSGTAETLPSGYGLHEYDRAEEGIQIDDMVVFKSDIRQIEVLTEGRTPGSAPDRLDELMGNLLEGPYWIVDILPDQVPADAGGQYFAVERYYLEPGRIRVLYRKFAEILLRLNCYCDMSVSFDDCKTWEQNPDPELFAARLSGLSGNHFLRAVFESQCAMIDIEPGDTCMTVYDPDSNLFGKLRALADAEGLFIWSPPN